MGCSASSTPFGGAGVCRRRRSQDPDALLLLLAARAECSDPSRLSAHAAGQLALPKEPLWPRRQAQNNGNNKRGGGGSTNGVNPSKN